MEKKSLSPIQGKLLCYPVTAAMVTCADGDEKNIIAITFIAPVTSKPPYGDDQCCARTTFLQHD